MVVKPTDLSCAGRKRKPYTRPLSILGLRRFIKCKLTLLENFLHCPLVILYAALGGSNSLMADKPNCDEGRLLLQGDLAAATDDELSQQMLEGKHEALGIVVDRYQRIVFSIALRIVRDKGEAEDLVQDVFLEIFRRVKLFDPAKGRFKVWLLRYAYTRSMNRRDHLEHRRFYKTVELDEAGHLAVPSRGLFDGSLTVPEVARFLQQALETLDPKQREAMSLIALEGMTLEEAARTMGCALSATKNYYYRGVMALRAFSTNQFRPSVRQTIHALAVGHGKTEVGHLKARPA
jgi:RNA polymerase sigma-70 factor (ECF subfamily)